MFNQGTIGSSKNVPQWILDLVDQVESWYGFCTDGVFFKESKSDYRGACYNVYEKNLQFYFGREKTVERICIVLHELAHAWQHLECPGTLTPKPKGRRNRIVHNQAFFEMACELYKKFGGNEVVEYAFNNEYKRGRKYMIV
jgi:hypothetical protein